MFRRLILVGSSAVLIGTAASLASAHVTVVPEESRAAAAERYGVRVPSEKSIPTTRVEVQFPEGLKVTELEAVPGWRIVIQKDRDGRTLGAVWAGGVIPPGQFVEFGVLAQNPDVPGELTWKMIQTFEDGSEVQWIGPAGAQFPGAITRVHASRGQVLTPERLAWTALVAAFAAAAWAVFARRRAAKAGR